MAKRTRDRAIRAIHFEGLPFNLHVETDDIGLDIRRVHSAAKLLDRRVDVKASPHPRGGYMLLVSPYIGTPLEQMLGTIGFTSYAAYIRSQLAQIAHGGSVAVNHLQRPKRDAHSSIRLEARPRRVSIRRQSEQVSIVTYVT